MVKLTSFLFATLIFVGACNTGKADKEVMNEKLQPIDINNPVRVITLKADTFQKELISNGKLKARRKSILKFSSSGELEVLRVKNGDFVREGMVIARLNQDKIRQMTDQAELQLAKAELELKDILLGQKYRLEDSTNIPDYVMKIAKLRSGYSAAVNEMQNTKRELENSVLTAPFPGIVANIEHQVYEQVNPSDEFCTLIDNSSFVVQFDVLESEMEDIRLGKSVKISPFVTENRVYPGRITEINPVVDEYGHIAVKALVENTDGLMEGMNVKVNIQTAVPNQLIVPKSAVVQRQNQEVLFRYTNGTAYWTYVQTGLENSTSFTVIAHPDKGASLVDGDTVIVSGNLNLAHGSVVVIE